LLFLGRFEEQPARDRTSTDTFLFQLGTQSDTVTDFEIGGSNHDLLAIDAAYGLTAGQVLDASHAQQVGGDVSITLSATDHITQKNVSLSTLTTHPNDILIAWTESPSWFEDDPPHRKVFDPSHEGETPSLPNSITWFETGGQTIVQLDQDGNATADMTIALAGTGLWLTSHEFIVWPAKAHPKIAPWLLKIFQSGVAANACAEKLTKLARNRGRTIPSFLREETAALKVVGKDAAYRLWFSGLVRLLCCPGHQCFGHMVRHPQRQQRLLASCWSTAFLPVSVGWHSDILRITK